MEIAVAQAVAFRHVGEAAEQELLSRLFEQLRSGNVGCQPYLQTPEFVGQMGVNARL